MPLRRTALQRKTPLQGGSPLKRTRLRQRSERKRAGEAKLDELREPLLRRSKGICEVRLPGCTRWATHPHHRQLRSQGGPHSMANLLHLCASCHRYAHTPPRFPIWGVDLTSYDVGLLVSREDDPEVELVRFDLFRSSATKN